jgi:hypothetical protein
VDDAERDFPIAGTHQYTVKIAPPPDAPAGNYPFRLDMLGVDNPDEELVQGPSVTFEVPAPEPARKPFPWWILIIVLVVILLGVGLTSFFIISGNGATASANATATAVARQTATAQALFGRYNGTWLKDESQPAGVFKLDISNSGPAISVQVTGDLEDVFSDTGAWAQRACPTGCVWGTETVNFAGDPVIVRFEFGPGGVVTHQLTLNVTGDGSTLVVADRTTFRRAIVANTTYNFHRQRAILDPSIRPTLLPIDPEIAPIEP